MVRIYLKDVYSNSFPDKNGVKRGAVISQVLFCIYIDKLLFNLEANGIGCFIVKMLAGGLAYAKDIVLNAPTSRVAFCLLVIVLLIISRLYSMLKNLFNI